jgi:hypothetical protein
VYSDFYEIPLPALRFEKVEETHRKVNNTEETTLDHVRSTKQKKKNVTKRRHTTLINLTGEGSQHQKTPKKTTFQGTTLPRTTRRQQRWNLQTTARIWKTTGF